MKILHSILLSLFLVPSVFSAPPSPLEALTHITLPPVEAPAAAAPYYTTAPLKGGYDITGLPAYIFTDEERLAAPLVKAISRTGRTLDVALYNLQIDETAQALIDAARRGVKVRAIFDYAHVFPKAGPQIQAVIDSGIETRVMKGRGGSGTMHCKYAIFDATLLQTGSANWSGFAENFSYENILFIADPEILGGYEANFEWMWRQARPVSDPSAPAARPTPPPSDPTPDVNFNGTMLPDYAFSPHGGTEAAMVRAIDAARKEADVAMFTFTSKKLMEALTRAANRGVSVKLMVFSGQKFPFYGDAKKSRVQLRFKTGREADKGQMHNKFAVLDGTLLINGSFNWTNMAENSNTENTIFTKAPEYVNAYQAEFDKLFNTAAE